MASTGVGEDIAFAGAARMAEMVREHEVSPTELVGLCLDRIARLDPQLNAFRKVFAEKAMLEAEQAEARVRAGERRPLLGVPIAIKDEIELAGEVRSWGTDAFDEPAKADSEMVRRLREAGAIIVGLTLLPELAICGFTESATYGVTRNPWNPQRTPAGSSGGSAAAVAAGLVPVASAGDGGGSIRLPAASCGLFGLKPQRGRVSLAPALEYWNGLAVLGCVSRNVVDTALWLDVVSGGSTGAGRAAAARAPFVESAQEIARQAAGRLVDRAAAGAGAAERLRRGRSRRSRMPPRCSPPSATRSASATPSGATSATTSPPASCAASPKPWTKCRIPSGSNAAPAASAGSAACCPTRSSRRPCRARPRTRAGSTRSSTSSTCW